jgi:hypothetical protein
MADMKLDANANDARTCRCFAARYVLGVACGRFWKVMTTVGGTSEPSLVRGYCFNVSP